MSAPGCHLATTTQHQLRKLVRFAGLYGWQRALNKAVARTRPGWLRNPYRLRRRAKVSLIGCGQFAFSAVCFYIQKHKGNVFLSAFDLDREQAVSLGRYYGFRQIAPSFAAVLDDPALRLLYIVSNHASHTFYAVAGLKRGIDVYVEKPVAVTYAQLVKLSAAQQSASGRLFAGYNRPYAAAIQEIKKRIVNISSSGSFSMSYFVNGHLIPADHWYRKPGEGTRVCGNLGHWIDLTIHIWQWRSLPQWIAIHIAYANLDEPDDNLCVTFTTDRHDLVSLMLTARTEPFEGISESVNLQYGDVIARVDDFRKLTLLQGNERLERHYRPKDVGHERAILQPYCTDNRDWNEVNVSTLLMLRINDMVVERQTVLLFDLEQELSQLKTDIQRELKLPAVHQPHP